MSAHAPKPVDTKWLLAGVTLLLAVSLATAAIIMWLPASPVYVGGARSEQVALNMNDYLQLHQGRNMVVPSHMRVGIETPAR